MRKITEQACRAFMAGERFSKGNMQVSVNVGNEVLMYLHGNLIARAYDVPARGDTFAHREIEIRDAGWQTVTTKERLNGLLSFFAPGVSIYQRGFAWYLDGTDVRGARDWQGSAVFNADGVYLCTGEMARAFA